MNNYKDEENQPIDVVVLQPNLEPYDNELQLQNYEIIDLLISLSQTKTDDNTSFILAPEGCLEERLWEDHIHGDASLSYLWMVVSHESEPFMPPNSPKIEDASLELIREWIDWGYR